MEIGNKIKEARNGAELTQDQAAEKIMVSRQTISNWETGKTMPDIASVIKMSDLYHISLDELLKGDQDMMKKIEKDTNIVRSNSRLIAVGIVAIIVAVVVTFASIMTGNAVLDFLAAALPWVFMGIALACFLATRKPDENTPKLRVAGFIPIMDRRDVYDRWNISDERMYVERDWNWSAGCRHCIEWSGAGNFILQKKIEMESVVCCP